jgi:hypothetical protein
LRGSSDADEYWISFKSKGSAKEYYFDSGPFPAHIGGPISILLSEVAKPDTNWVDEKIDFTNYWNGLLDLQK